MKRVAELQKRRMISGYLNDDKFDTPAAIQRIMASPRRGQDQEPTESHAIGGQKPLNTTNSTATLDASVSQ